MTEYNVEQDGDVTADVGDTASMLPSPVSTFITDVTVLEGDDDLTTEEAQYLTEMIRATADMMWVLLSRAHSGKAWKALGYDSFGTYVKDEFNISRSRAYQLLHQASMIEALEAAAPEGTQVHINESAVRDLKNRLDDLVPEVAARTEGMTPDDAAVEIANIVAEARESITPATPVDAPVHPVVNFDEDEPLPEIPGGDFISPHDEDIWRGPASGPVPGGDVVPDDLGDDIWSDSDDGPTPTPSTPVFHDDDDEDWFDEDEDEENDGDAPVGPAKATPVVNSSVLDDDEDDINPALLRKRVQSAYDLYSTLMTMAEMPLPEDVIAIIPAERRILVNQSITPVIDWLTDFRAKWEAQPWQTKATDGE